MQYPKGYLKRAFKRVRELGGVCISDEVQTGFGRTGEHYWGFQGHDVVPDIVTLAKGIGNGFPIGAVVTTPEIAKVMTRVLILTRYYVMYAYVLCIIPFTATGQSLQHIWRKPACQHSWPCCLGRHREGSMPESEPGYRNPSPHGAGKTARSF